MKIVIATPLYPPDIEPTAVYVKELARRLAHIGEEVTVATYGRLPEPIPGVRIIGVDKRAGLLTRLINFRHALNKAAQDADVVYIENGPSVELPVALSSFRGKIILHLGDPAAHAYAQKKFLRGLIEGRVAKRARSVISDSPLIKPEILPFAPAPDMAPYEASWSEHLGDLMHVFTT